MAPQTVDETKLAEPVREMWREYDSLTPFWSGAERSATETVSFCKGEAEEEMLTEGSTRGRCFSVRMRRR